MTEIIPKRALSNGRWDRELKKQMVALSKADNYEEAKHEWIATGKVWWEEIGDPTNPPEYVSKHPFKCLCGHNIVYHFEIHNTETDVRECVGSDHINSYLILRAIREETGLSDEQITDKMIEEWITVRVEALKKTAWWNMHGSEFTKMFDAVKDMDLRINVRKSGRYYDATLRMYRDKTFIRKRAEGNYGETGYQMASIVWRWNHPDNPKNQQARKGYPNQKLFNDLLMFYFTLEQAEAQVKKEEDFVAERQEQLRKHDEMIENRRKAAIERKQKIVATVEDIKHQPVFVEACEYYGIKPFVPEQGKDSWEERFLLDIKNKMIKGMVLTENQSKKLWEILDSDKKEVLPATERQKNYLIRLGYEGDIDDISKSDASSEISKLKKEKWG
tara:strand:- start:6183 stop:7346 length:1164 start_codon:yes stop_codon:yes gene_type:complete